MPFHGRQGTTQKIAIWPRVGTDPSSQPIVSITPQDDDARWDDTRKEVRTAEQGVVTIDATISGFETDLPIGSAVWKGGLEAIPGTGHQPILDVMQVVTFSSTADIRGREFYREATLMRVADALGTQGAGQ